MSIDKPKREFKGIWIPKEIWLNERLTYFEKFLLAEINSLDDEVRGCWADNVYFMKFFGVSERHISTAITKLKNLGLIHQAHFDGRERSLKMGPNPDKEIFCGSESQSQNVKEIFCGSDPQKTSTLTYNRENSIENIKKEPYRVLKKEPEKLKFIDHVLMTKEEYEKLLKELGEAKTQEMIKRLDAYIGSKGKKYKSHYKTILSWILKDEKDKIPQEKENPEKKGRGFRE